ncbi:hypothetical protein L208DRAFT_1250112, partial [Tricholoma matsutake]
IVLVHGLRGHRTKTWTKDNVCWPRDLLSKEETLSHIRVLTFGYDANVVSLTTPASLNSLLEHSVNLLNELARERKQGAPGRNSTIFVAHSLGGLIVKDALDYSDRHKDTKSVLAPIFPATKGIIFLGTPHRGSGKSSLARVIATIAQVALQSTNSDLIRDLERDSQTLDRIRDSFSAILDRRNLTVWSFEEELPMGMGIGLVVSRESAILGDARENRDSIHADHVGMSKFSTTSDAGYKKILHAVEVLVEGIQGSENEPASGNQSM